jgi:hypothetical protein
MKFDVNKIITESIAEAAGEVITEELEIMKGYYGNKLYDKLHPEKPDLAFETVKKLGKKLKDERAAAEGMGVKEHLAKAGQKAVAGAKETAIEAKDAVVGAGQKAIAATKEAATSAGQKVADVAKTAVDDKSVAGHLAKSFKKIKNDAQEGATNIGHKVANHLGNLDYGNTALAAGGALAAGLGALALRKRLKKVK